MALKNYPSLERNIIFKTSIFRSKILVFQGGVLVTSAANKATERLLVCLLPLVLQRIVVKGLITSFVVGEPRDPRCFPPKKPGESRLVVFRRETGKDIKNLLHPHFDEPKFIHGTG